MAKWNVALVREQGVNFAVALVKDHVVQSRQQSEKLVSSLTMRLRQPVVLLGEDNNRYYGRSDIVRFLQHVHPSRLPWREVTFN
ncbi:hypothetical protein NN6n1_18630 [Shinella zoogloeoides]